MCRSAETGPHFYFAMYHTIREFYSSNAWRKCRDNYWRKRKGLCERCLAKGILKKGDQVHHKKRLTIHNINDPRVTTNEDNLEVLCKECHEEEHKPNRTTMFSKKRYVVDRQTGRVYDIPPGNDKG